MEQSARTVRDEELLSRNRTYHHAQSSMELLPNYYHWTYDAFREQLAGVVLELGCGSGTGIQCYCSRVERVVAVDYNEELVERVRARFPGSNVEARQVDLLDGWSALEDVRADCILMMDVVEHFKDDVGLLRSAARHLDDGGALCVKVPAGRARYSDFDRASGHFRRYDKADLERLAQASGLRLERIQPINVVGAIAYGLKSRRSRKSNFSSSFSSWQLRLINAVIPALRLGDTLGFMPGLSWVAVFRAADARA